MLGGLFIILVTGMIAVLIIGKLKRKYPFLNDSLLRNLFVYHVFISIVYYLYVQYNRSDSIAYYLSAFEADDWHTLYGTSTSFIRFLAYPFIRHLGFSYEAIMALFAFFGYLGFLYTYVFFVESTRFTHRVFGINLLSLIFFLPNLHFWSGSLGKGSVIFLGIGLFFFGINKAHKRWLAIVIGALLIYHVRPHILLVILVSTAIGLTFSSKGVNATIRMVLLCAASIAFFFIYQDVLTMVGIDDEEVLTQGLDLTHRASELSKATSGVQIANYSLPLQLFTFLFRPLFFDAPGLLGIIVSFENVFYLFLALKILSLRGLRFLITGNFIVKSAFLSFLTVSIALAQISGNLGLAIRQKSQVMILFMFVILLFLDQEKYKQWRFFQMKRKRAETRKPKPVTSGE